MSTLREAAMHYFKEGNNCSESIVKAGNECLGLGLQEEALRMVSVFGGGVGGAGCICGALSGACMVLGVLAGRIDVQEKTKAAMNAPVKEFYTQWMERFHASCCRVLKSHAFGGPVSCADLIAETADMLEVYVTEKKLAANR